MLKSAASLDAGGTLTVAADRNEMKAMKPASAMPRFAYSTGSRPLDGFTIKRGVGAGGFGEVYFAISDAGKEVALKRIQRNLDVELRGVSQCLNLKHPNLVAIYDIRYDDEGQAWVVMEYVRGESLKDVIDRNPNGLPTGQLVSWMRGIAAGVAYLHDHGIVHRDLKPGNIFLDEGLVKIGDYGLSKYISCSRRSGQTESVGTFHYMAPEIGRGVYGKEIDVYALGVIFYELLTGRVPFDGESSHEIIMKHLTALPEVEGISPQFRPIVERSLFKDPAKRYRQVAELMVDIESAAQGDGENASPNRSTFMSSPSESRSPDTGDRPSPTTRAHGAQKSTADIRDDMYFGTVRQTTMAEVVRHAPKSQAPSEEPIAVALREGATRFVEWWNSSALNRTSRILLAVLFVFLFFTNAAWIMPLTIVLGSVYLVYFGIRAILLSLEDPMPAATGRPHPDPVPQPVVATVVPEPTPNPTKRTGARKRRKWSDVARQSLERKSLGERLTELLGAFLVSTVVVAVVSYLALLVANVRLDGSTTAWTSFAWLSLVSLTGTWALLGLAKMWEGREEDAVRRRFAQMVLGLGVGSVAFGLATFLGLSLESRKLFDTPTAFPPPTGAFGPDGIPHLPGCLAFFGGLFLILRWWQQADPLRPVRFSLWNAFGTLLVAGVWQIFWPFPQPWSLAVPVVMSIALQLSSTWVNSTQRAEFKRQAEA